MSVCVDVCDRTLIAHCVPAFQRKYIPFDLFSSSARTDKQFAFDDLRKKKKQEENEKENDLIVCEEEHAHARANALDESVKRVWDE